MPEDINRGEMYREDRDENRDPISGKPGSHPVGTAVGGVAGGAAGAAGGAAAGAAAGAAMGTAAGPVGTAVGGVVGVIAGAAAGHAIAEKVNPTAEEAYWREHHRDQPYAAGRSYNDYHGAYATGWEGYSRYGGQGRRYEDVEADLRRDYEAGYGTSGLSWDNARPAVRAAWGRFDRNLEQYIGCDVLDRNGEKIGTLDCLWADHTGEPAFVGVRTGWLFGRTHVVPADQVTIGQRHGRIRLPYDTDKVKNAPAYDADENMTEAREREIYDYYGIAGTGTRETTTARHQSPGQEEARMSLSEETLKVGRREVEAGGVRLRKVVRTETVNQPVDLKREEVVVERVPAQEGTSAQSFDEQEMYIPLRREEPVIQKEAHVREEVRARKTTETDRQDVSDSVRREDVEVETTGEAASRVKGAEGLRRGRATDDRPRSQRLHDEK